ncbi:TPA: NUDIX domain-containing protein [Candidatus Woesearchaeota archaeon]|nr:NUDIX domain-containing protein [Candidatus Woesearchaeota archaeon]HIH32191.1 NUDIX domain-containing protein [Candidatus Woesearchaeota archaeon]HIH55578.1 NUDIX domain-containing protein [Candidatus Woesearchaeota archaeon]HIJ02550.1 NUDIX domain-containing protein [Candidatus Woesearchaeota archaeon]HIJ13404.1 NUDIX domain-containing protein [Candidatus Woesearchaeota archaeon]
MKEQSAGGVILKGDLVVVVAQQRNTYSLPKGHVEGDEEPLVTSYREIYEETGLKKEDLIFVKKLETYTRPDGRSGAPKDIHMFLFTTKKEKLHPIDKENPDAKWVVIEKVSEKLTYKEDREFFLRHIKEYKRI